MVSEFTPDVGESLLRRRNSGELKVDPIEGSGSPGGTLGSEAWSSADLSGSEISALEKQIRLLYNNGTNTSKSGGTEPKADDEIDSYKINEIHTERTYRKEEDERVIDVVAESTFDNYESLVNNNNNRSGSEAIPASDARPDVVVEVDQKIEVLNGNDEALSRELSAICSRSSSMSPLSVSDVSSPSADGDTPSPVASAGYQPLVKGTPTDMDLRMAELMERERKVQEREKYLQSLEIKLLNNGNSSIQVSPIQKQLNPELDEEPSEVMMNWPEFGGTVKTVGSNSPVQSEPADNQLTDYEKMVASLAAADAAERTAINHQEEDITTAEHNVSRPPDAPLARSPQVNADSEGGHYNDDVDTAPETPPTPFADSTLDAEKEQQQQQHQHQQEHQHQPEPKPVVTARVKEVKERLSRLEGRIASSSSASTSTSSQSQKSEPRTTTRKIIKKTTPVAVQSAGSQKGRSVVPQMSQIITDSNPLNLKEVGRGNGRAPMREREREGREGVTLHQPVVAQQNDARRMPTSPQSPTPSGGSQGDLYPLFLEFMHSLEGRREGGALGGIPSSAASSASAHSQQSAQRPLNPPHQLRPSSNPSTRRTAAMTSARSNSRTRNEVSTSLYPDYFNRFHSYEGPPSNSSLNQVKRDSKIRLQELRKSHIRDRDQMAKRLPSAERRRRDREKVRGTLTPLSSQSAPNAASSGPVRGRAGRARNPSVELRKIGRSNSRDGPRRPRVTPSPGVRVGRSQSADRQLGRSNSARSTGSVGRPRPAWRPGGGSPSPSPLVARRTFSPSSQLLQTNKNTTTTTTTAAKGMRTRSPATVVRIGTSAPKRLVVTPRDTSTGPKSRRWL